MPIMSMPIPDKTFKELQKIAEEEGITYVEAVKRALEYGICAIKEKKRNSKIYSFKMPSEAVGIN